MTTPIAVAGYNCWRRCRADRLAFLVDGADYFRALKAALLAARQSVLILGWEFDSRVRLERGEPSQTIGELLRAIVRREPRLEVDLLIWDSALIYSWDREFLPVVKHDWLTQPRLRFCLDDSHPFGASHHQKVVVVDDKVAFIGGLDISSRRWDCPEHRPDDPRRSDPGFPLYPAFHDVQCMVSGEAASALGDLARARWRNATGQQLTPPPPDHHDPWPSWLVADVEDAQLALARTLPPWEGEPPVREVEQLFLDMISAAEGRLYVENQYFASHRVAALLERCVAADRGPEIAVVSSGFTAGFLERTVMGGSRARLQARLQAADRHGRLGFYAPVIAGRPLKVHAKVMIADDLCLKIGSANLNNRSMGLDSECDLFLEAGGELRIERAIAALRHRLLAEHLGSRPEMVAEAESRLGLQATILELGREDRRLVPYRPEMVPPGELLPDPELLDPDGPFETTLMAAADAPPLRLKQPLAARFATGMGLLALLALIAAFWHELPHDGLGGLPFWLEDLRGQPLAPLLVVGIFLLAGLTGLPVFLLVVGVGALFGGWLGGLYSLCGVLLSAGFSYSLGQALGRDRMRRLMGGRASRISRALLKHGIIAMAMMRIVPVASFTAVNLMAGAARVGRGVFLLGSILGLLPMVVGLSLFGDRFAAALERPDGINTALLTMLTLALAIAGTALVGRLRRVAPLAVGGSSR